MKKRITSMFLVLLMVLSLMPATVQASPASSGSGTKADPYLIATAQDLIEFRDEVNALTKKSTSTLCAKLTKDIDLSNLEGDWEPIGKATNTYKDYVAYGLSLIHIWNGRPAGSGLCHYEPDPKLTIS